MFIARTYNSKFSNPKFHIKYHWSKFSAREFKQNFVKVCAYERNGMSKYKAYYWQTVRMKMVRYFETNFGIVPEVLKLRRMPNDPFIPSMDKEYKKWLNVKS